MALGRMEHEQKEDEGEMTMEIMEMKLDAQAAENQIKLAGMRQQNKLKAQAAKATAGNGKK